VSRIASIQECDGSTPVCKGATTFKYNEEMGWGDPQPIDMLEEVTADGSHPALDFTPFGFFVPPSKPTPNGPNLGSFVVTTSNVYTSYSQSPITPGDAVSLAGTIAATAAPTAGASIAIGAAA